MTTTPRIPQAPQPHVHAPRTTKSLVRKLRFACYRAYRSILVIKDDPKHIAWGVAIGTFVAYLPIVGVQMIIGAIACKLARANVMASIPLAWITNPVTIAPIYFLLFLLGGVFTGDSMTYAEMDTLVGQIITAGIFSWEGLQTTVELFADIFWPMLIGGCIVGIVNGTLFYYLTLTMILRTQQQRHARLTEWQKKSQPHLP